MRSLLFHVTSISFGLLLILVGFRSQGYAQSVASDLLLATIYLNSQNTGEVTFVLRQNGTLYLKPSILKKLDFRAPANAEEITFQDNVFISLGQIPGLKASLSASGEILYLACKAKCFVSRNITVKPNAPPALTARTGGLILGYEVVAEDGPSQEGTVNAFGDLHYATSLGRFYTGLVASTGKENGKLARLETNWTIESVSARKRLTLGDSISGASDWSIPVRFGGIRFGTDFSLQPGFVAFPTPNLNASAALPSTVDVYINDLQRFSHHVPAGPFTLEDVPFISGKGEARVVVTDVLGRQTVITEAFYAAPSMLKSGLQDYSIEAGALRNSYARQNFDYGQAFTAATWRAGINDHLTLQSHVEIAETSRSAGLGATFLVGTLGTFSSAFAASEKDGKLGFLGQAAIDLSHRGWRGNLTVEATDRHYTQLGQSPETPAPAVRVRARLGLPDFKWVRTSLVYLYDDRRNSDDLETFSANVNVTLGSSMTLSFSAIQSLQPNRFTAVGLSLSLPIGPHTVAAANIQSSRGNFSSGAYVQRAPDYGKTGYRARVTEGDLKRYEASIIARPRFAWLELGASHTNGRNAARLTARGSAVLDQGSFYLAEKMNDGYAIVGLPKGIDARVYQDHRLIGRTGPNGRLFIPDLRAYEKNRIEVDIRDLPLNAPVEKASWDVVPAQSAGAVLSINIPDVRPLMVRLISDNGLPLSPGTEIYIRSSIRSSGGDNTEVPYAVVGHNGISFINIETRKGPLRLIAGQGIDHCQSIINTRNLPVFSQLPKDIICKRTIVSSR